MSQKKIIFLVIVGILALSIIIGFAYISNKQQNAKPKTSTMKIWITDGTSESYQKLVDGFKKYAPEYARTEILIEKQTSDPDRYRTLLLSTATEGSGPDIFMLKKWEDDILESKVEPIPSDVLDFSDFEKRYDDIFRDLVYSTGSGEDKKTVLQWVPLGFETLWIFYNKTLIRDIPKTLDELDLIYTEWGSDSYPTNLGLSPTFTPNMVEVYPLWLKKDWVESYVDVYDRKSTLESYMSYWSLDIKKADTNTTNGENTDNQTISTENNTSKNLNDEKSGMIKEKMTTLDLFMEGKISMIFWYPSTILELEKSSKRVKESIDNNDIITERIFQSNKQKKQNIWRYNYFWISKYTKNGLASVKFLEYLLTPEAQRIYMGEYPYIIPAQVEFYASTKKIPLSENFSKTTLSSFVPLLEEKVTVFHYGIKSKFERYLRDGLDTDEPDIESITKNISIEIGCEINWLTGWSVSSDCQSN